MQPKMFVSKLNEIEKKFLKCIEVYINYTYIKKMIYFKVFLLTKIIKIVKNFRKRNKRTSKKRDLEN